MNANPKSTKDPADAVRSDIENFPVTFANIFHRGVERLADLHKNTLDTINQHTSDVNETLRQAFRASPTMPGMMFMDLAEQTMGRMVEAEKNIVDIMVKQSAHMLEMTRTRTADVSKTAETVKELVNQSAEGAVAVHKIVLDLAAEQNKAVADTVRRQAGVAGTPIARAADTMEHNVGTAIETQKEILEAAAKPLRAGTAKA